MSQTATLSRERQDLLATLDKHRGFLRQTLAGMSDEQIRLVSTVSQLSLGSVLKHVTATETTWRNFMVKGAAAFDEMSFLAPIQVGQLAVIDACITLVDRSSMEIRVRVESEDLLTGERRHTSTAYVTFVALDPVTKRPAPVPPLVLEADDERAEHTRALERRQLRLERRKRESRS